MQDKEPRFSLENLQVVLKDCLRLAKVSGIAIDPGIADRLGWHLQKIFNRRSIHVYFKFLKVIRRVGFKDLNDAKNFMACFVFLPLYGINKFDSYGKIITMDDFINNP